MTKKESVMEAMRLAESAMFHVLSDDGFNSMADREAMREALSVIRVNMTVLKTMQEAS